jgi:hypothetical protein
LDRYQLVHSRHHRGRRGHFLATVVKFASDLNLSVRNVGKRTQANHHARHPVATDVTQSCEAFHTPSSERGRIAVPGMQKQCIRGMLILVEKEENKSSQRRNVSS